MAPKKPDPKEFEAAKAQREQEFAKFLEGNKDQHIAVIERASAKNPTIDQQVFKDFADAVHHDHPGMVRDMTEAFKLSTTPADLQKRTSDVRIKHGEEIRNKIIQQHGKNGNAAMMAVAREGQPQSVFAGPVQTIYNTENGGPQWGGLAGGLITGLLGFIGLQNVGGLSSWVQIAGALAIGAVGAYALHKAVDPKPEPLKLPDFHTKSGGAIASRDKQRQKADEFGTIIAQNKDTAVPTTEHDVRSLGIKDKNFAKPETGAGLGTMDT